MRNKLYTILSGGFSACHFIRVGENRSVNTYVGRDELGRFSFDFRGKFKATKIKSSDVIMGLIFLRVMKRFCAFL